MRKTLVLNFEDIKIEGNILDVACESLGIINSISEEAKSEIAVDYVEKEEESMLQNSKYDACTFFFNLNSLWNINKREKLINEISDYLEKDGSIYIWDINKNIGELVDSKLKVLLPKGDIREYRIKNNNLFSSSSFEETKKILEKTFKIEETKVWEDIYFIRGIKI
ncbi:hypothetical protein K5V21_06855 [Clostridium sardiniense]|uniref:Class I SAM-dependent methyltransferase n=1 Tax=Clostridium sardiniense TaxID=29369 RepID=A0ABS7KWK7_CLOSR|nr:hypothetical protein [Clostridium sardiniense]MBY0755171.1 hypothetical protein [Clostridium sardiniense]MDQ0461118.1 SAM-dependent methyltransferase [Clostridium sardiniense]